MSLNERTCSARRSTECVGPSLILRSHVRRPADKELLPLLRAQRLRPAQVGGPHGLGVVAGRNYALGARNLARPRSERRRRGMPDVLHVVRLVSAVDPVGVGRVDRPLAGRVRPLQRGHRPRRRGSHGRRRPLRQLRSLLVHVVVLVLPRDWHRRAVHHRHSVVVLGDGRQVVVWRHRRRVGRVRRPPEPRRRRGAQRVRPHDARSGRTASAGAGAVLELEEETASTPAFESETVLPTWPGYARGCC